MSRNDTRVLHIFGQEWEYKIGRNTVAIYDSEGNRYFPKFEEILGEGDLHEKLRNKMIQITPHMVKDYITVTILKSTPTLRQCSRCKEKKEDVKMTYNPYGVEICGDYTKSLYCDDCIDDLAEEI